MIDTFSILVSHFLILYVLVRAIKLDRLDRTKNPKAPPPLAG